MYRPPAWLRLIVAGIVAVAGAYLLLARPAFVDAASIGAALSEYGAAAWLVFIALHAVVSLVFVPRTVMGIAAGVLFGFWWGLAVGIAGALAGAAAGFALARYVNSGLLVVEEI